jgi:RNA polymerase sigma factor (sigma-70 family)
VEGARPTFEDVFRHEYAAIVRTVAPILGSGADAEAVSQEAFAKAFARWARVGRYDRPGAWIRRVAIRDAVRFAERRHRSNGRPVDVTDPGDGVVTRMELQQALQELTPKQRACIVLHHIAGWPVAEVAAAVGCSEATVRVHLHRARARLASRLAQGNEEVRDGR